MYQQFIAPQEKKIVWYRVRDLPRIDPIRQMGDSATPQAREQKRDVIINIEPDAQTARQLVFQHNKKQLQKETPAPNVVALQGDTHARTPPKLFSPPPPSPPAPPAPAEAMAALAQTPLPVFRRAFVRPPATPKRAMKQTDLLPPPEARIGENANPGTGQADALGRSLTRLPGKTFVPPAARSGTGPSRMNVPEPAPDLGGGINAAVLSTSPTAELLSKLPEGVRRADLSAAPRVGPRSTGSPGDHAPEIPGLVLQPGGAAQEKPPANGPAETKVVYEETHAGPSHKTLSAPLRPSSRTIPAAIEARFHGRVVYTMVIPMPRLPLYSGDWILWFAETRSADGTASQMRAPLPVRKVAPAGGSPDPQPSGRVKLTATILKSGRIESVEVMDKPGIPSKIAAAADLQFWEFEPALKDGQPVDVEIIIEIPFQ